ncbi:WD40 repeat domain-containing protein [Dyadobacter sp. SG02]|uniref:WD40 repeat domain-containing protein n=1 Tax=Dyadobacter sp. SG02 TaxID=1855291 RepID=UPI0015A5841A|nr:PD40 domain-containing protein [Dyadobacter sp. SG02]
MKAGKLLTSLILSLALHLIFASCSSTRPTLPGKLVNETPTSPVFSPDGKLVAAGIFGGVRVWDADSENFRDYLTKLKNETPSRIFFSPDGKWIAAGVYGAVRTWELATGASHDYPMKLRNETPRIIAISPDGQTIATATFGGLMKWKFQGFPE